MQDACQGDNAVLLWSQDFEHPIPLLNNIDLGQMACEYYRIRFKIETLLRQLKSAGFYLNKCKVEDATQVQNLLMVVALARQKASRILGQHLQSYKFILELE